MQIEKTERFFSELESILEFIAQDSFSRALSFKGSLDENIQSLPEMPYKYRQSIKSNNQNVRDMIFMGYVIPYHINHDRDRIELLGMFSSNEWND
jgi:toxin ParE1/3/4